MASQVAELLGGEHVLGKDVKSNLDLARATREGLPAQSAIYLAESILAGAQAGHALARVLATLPEDVHRAAASAAEAFTRFQTEWTATNADIERTLGPMKEVIDSVLGGLTSAQLSVLRELRRLDMTESDIVYRTASVLSRAIDVLGDETKGVHWLTTANRALGGEVPITLLDTSAGTREVEALLDRVEYGVYS